MSQHFVILTNETHAAGNSQQNKKPTVWWSIEPSRPRQAKPWLDPAHKRFDEAVFAAYGWKPDLSDEEIL